MGCMQTRVVPSNLVNKNESTESQVQIIQNGLDESTTYPLVTHQKSLTTLTSVVFTTTTMNSFQLNDYRDVDTNANSNSIKETILESVDMDSTISDIPLVSSISISSSDFNQTSPINPTIISTSTDLERKTFRKDAINRFFSAKPNRKLTDVPLFNQTNVSYSHDNSLIDSAASEKPVVNQRQDVQTICNQSKKSNLQNNVYRVSDESILNPVTGINSTLKEKKIRINHRSNKV